MTVARHKRPAELEQMSLEEIMRTHIGRFSDKRADWAAFEDAKIEGYRRAQHRFIGAGGSGKHSDPDAIPARGLPSVSCMCRRGRAMLRTRMKWRKCSLSCRASSW